MKGKFQFFVVLVLFIGGMIGERLIISSNGTVNSNCNETTPCSAENALMLAKESDILFFQDGTYNISQVLYITVGNLTLVGQSQENTILKLSMASGSGINSTFPFQISNFTLVGEGNFNSSSITSNAISILPLSSNTTFPFNISTRIEKISFNGNFTGLSSIIGCKKLTTPIYITNIYFDDAFLNSVTTFTFFVFIESVEDIIIDQITSIDSQSTQMFYLSSKNLIMSNLNITNADASSLVECRANSTIFDSIFIQYSKFGFSTFSIYSNYTTFNHFNFVTSSTSIVGVISMENLANFYLNNTSINSPSAFFTIESYYPIGNITIENSEFLNATVRFGPAESVTLINNYFNNNEYDGSYDFVVTSASNTIIKNCTFEDLGFYQHQFVNTDENYLYVSESQFIDFGYEPWDSKIALVPNDDDYLQQANQTVTVQFEECAFVNLQSPVYLFRGAMNVTFNNCEFEELGNPWVSLCPTNGSTLYFVGDQTKEEDPNVLVADEDMECNLYCSSNFDVICERGADEGSPISVYVWISIALFVIIATIFIFAVTYFIVKKKLNRRSSYDSLPPHDPLNS